MLNQGERDYRTAGKMISALSFTFSLSLSLALVVIFSPFLVKLHSDHIKSFVTIQFCLLCMFGLSNMLFRCPFVNGQSLSYALDEHMRLGHHLSLFFVVFSFNLNNHTFSFIWRKLLNYYFHWRNVVAAIFGHLFPPSRPSVSLSFLSSPQYFMHSIACITRVHS